MPNDGGDTTVGPVESALTVLEALVPLDGAGLTELAAELSLSKSTIHNHLQTLSKRGTSPGTGRIAASGWAP